MNETLKADFGKICEMAYRAKNVDEAAVAAFYLYQIFKQLNFDAGNIAVKYCELNQDLPEMQEAMWRGFSVALWASKCQIAAFRPVPVNSFRGRLIKVELREIEHAAWRGGDLDFNLGSLVEKTKHLHNSYNEIKNGLLRY